MLDEIVASVAEAHRQVDLSHKGLRLRHYGSEIMRPYLLAALLRLADHLDITFRRVHMDRLKLMNPPVDSCLHWYLCYYVSSVQIERESEYITIYYRFPPKCSHYSGFMEALVDRKVRNELEELEPIFRLHGVKSALSRHSEVEYCQVLLEPLPAQVEALASAECDRYHQEEILRHLRKMGLTQRSALGDYHE